MRSFITSRMIRWAGYIARMGAKKNAYRILVGNPKGKRPLGIHRNRWENNLKWDGKTRFVWLGHGQMVCSFVHGNELSDSIACWEYLGRLRG